MSKGEITWKDILLKIGDMPQPFKVTQVAEEFDMQLGEAGIRVSRLRNWGYIRYFNRVMRGYHGYVLTKYGKEKVEELRNISGGNNDS